MLHAQLNEGVTLYMKINDCFTGKKVDHIIHGNKMYYCFIHRKIDEHIIHENKIYSCFIHRKIDHIIHENKILLLLYTEKNKVA